MKALSSLHFAPVPAYPASVDSLQDLVGELRKSVGQRLTREFRRQLPVPLIRRALDEASETAWATGFPHLFFPALAEERVRMIHGVVSDDPHFRASFRQAA